MKKFLALLVLALITIGFALYGILQLEFVKKYVHDKKADYLGTDRTVTFYAKMTGEKVKSFSDTDTRVTLEPNGIVSVWLGSSKRKIMSDMDFILEDNINNNKKGK